jgi:hypothetical protein
MTRFLLSLGISSPSEAHASPPMPRAIDMDSTVQQGVVCWAVVYSDTARDAVR